MMTLGFPLSAHADAANISDVAFAYRTTMPVLYLRYETGPYWLPQQAGDSKCNPFPLTKLHDQPHDGGVFGVLR